MRGREGTRRLRLWGRRRSKACRSSLVVLPRRSVAVGSETVKGKKEEKENGERDSASPLHTLLRLKLDRMDPQEEQDKVHLPALPLLPFPRADPVLPTSDQSKAPRQAPAAPASCCRYSSYRQCHYQRYLQPCFGLKGPFTRLLDLEIDDEAIATLPSLCKEGEAVPSNR